MMPPSATARYADQARRQARPRGVRPLLASALVALVPALSACRSLDPEVRTPAAAFPDTYSRRPERTVEAPDRWWEAFASDELDRLVAAALATNLDLTAAWARLQQAQAQAVKAGAAGALNLEGRIDRGRTTVVDGSDREFTHSYGLGLTLGWEADLWGRINAGEQAAVAARDASQADLRATALALSGNVVDAWVQLQAGNAEIALIQEQVKTNRQRLDILRGRRRKALSSSLDVLQQRQTLAAAQALLPPLREQRELLLDRLALLLAQEPGSLAVAVRPLPELPPLPAPGLPADLLARRPDIQAAFLRLQAGDWDVTAARADRLPALRLTGSASAESAHLDELFDDWIARLAGGLVAPLLDGGRRRSEVARARAVVDERLVAYHRAVLAAVHEVEAALVAERHQREQLAQTQAQLALAQRTRSEADRRYRNGVTDYITVLSAVAAVQRLERERLRVRARLLRTRITLYKALGGAWPSELQPPAENVKEEPAHE